MNIETVPKFVEKAFRNAVYTVEYDGSVGGKDVRLYADNYCRPTFCNTNGLVFPDMGSVVTYLHRFEDSQLFFKNHPLVCEYYNSLAGIARSVIDTAENIVRELSTE